MADYEAHINTKYGWMVIHFTDKTDLEKKLEEVTGFNQLIDSKSSGIALVKEEDVPGLEGICKMSSDGLPKIVVYPDTGSDKIRLALYASRRPLSSEEITKVTGVVNPTANRVMKFEEVITSGGKYSLSGKGRTYFTTEVLPELREKLQPVTSSK